MDFRKLNVHKSKINFTIPITEDLLDKLHGANVFSKLHLMHGYDQIRMKPEHVHKKSFQIYCGHTECLVISFTLSNALVSF